MRCPSSLSNGLYTTPGSSLPSFAQCTIRGSAMSRGLRGGSCGLSGGKSKLLAGAVLRPHGVHAVVLPRREQEHAGVVGVVHEVGDGIDARVLAAAARVAPRRTAERRRALRGGVAHVVVVPRAAA